MNEDLNLADSTPLKACAHCGNKEPYLYWQLEPNFTNNHPAFVIYIKCSERGCWMGASCAPDQYNLENDIAELKKRWNRRVNE